MRWCRGRPPKWARTTSAAAEEPSDREEGWRPQRGGMLNLSTVGQNLSSVEQEELFGAKFAGETNKRDEDADMLKYIDEELAKRRKTQGAMPTKEKEVDSEDVSARRSAADPLEEVSDMLKPSIQKRKEDMLSQQMLTGIPEVDLGIQTKIRNIEATEEAKQRLLAERLAAQASTAVCTRHGLCAYQCGCLFCAARTLEGHI